MPRPIPLLVSMATALTLILILLWATSYVVCTRIARGGIKRDACVILANGYIIFRANGGRQEEPPFAGRELQRGEWSVQVGLMPTPVPHAFMRPMNGFPVWVFALLPALVPMVWLDHRRAARKRAQQTLCAECGYDLRATPDRCPECGTAVMKPAVAAPASTTPAD